MKIVITESKIDDAIYKYIDSIIDVDDIRWSHPDSVDDDDNGDESVIDYFWGGGYSNTDLIFSYYTPEYYKDPSSISFRKEAPILELSDNDLFEKLDSLFGNRWDKPFIKWFENTFGLPVKTLSIHIEE